MKDIDWCWRAGEMVVEETLHIWCQSAVRKGSSFVAVVESLTKTDTEDNQPRAGQEALLCLCKSIWFLLFGTWQPHPALSVLSRAEAITSSS
jgi:hypothetical protein